MHRSKSKASQTAFQVDVEILLHFFNELRANPFEDKSENENNGVEKVRELYNKYTKEVVSDLVVTTIMNIEEQNGKQYPHFIDTRLKAGSESNVFAPMTKNKIVNMLD